MHLILCHKSLNIIAADYIDSSIEHKASALSIRSQSYLAKRLALACILQKYEHYADRLNLVEAAGQKPYLKDGTYQISFSDSQSLCAIAYDKHSVGLDIEYIKKRHNIDMLANKYLSSQEYTHFLSLNKDERIEFFIKQWTIQEAVVKFFGYGIQKLSLIKFDFAQKNIDVSAFNFNDKNLKLLNAKLCYKNFDFAISLCSFSPLEHIYYVTKRGYIINLKPSRYLSNCVYYTLNKNS